MKVRVRLFAAAKDLAGCDVLPLEVTQGATITDVRTALLTAAPALSNIVSHALWAVDAEYATETTIVSEECEVALIPPVSGG